MTLGEIGSATQRLLAVQFAGDFRAAYELWSRTGEEEYFGHSHVLGQLTMAANEFDAAGVVTCISGEPFYERLDTGVVVAGAAAHPDRQHRAVETILEHFDPTHVVVLGPMPRILRWSIRTGRRTMCLMADSFNRGRIVRLLRYGSIISLLNDPRIEVVANHNRDACGALIRQGVDPEKVIAWDWPRPQVPSEPPRTLDVVQPSIFYAGALSKQKGLDDLVRAVGRVRSAGWELELRVAGGGDFERYRRLAHVANIAEGGLTLLGQIPNSEVMTEMRRSTLVAVPSRHSYPEGMPLTIYEALDARTPIVASDHPMFRRILRGGETALTFRAGDVTGLANAITTGLSDADIYSRLSAAASNTLAELAVPVSWGDLVRRWVRDSDEDKKWLDANSESRYRGNRSA